MTQNDFEKNKTAFLDKLKSSLDAFMSGVTVLKPKELIDRAQDIAGVQLCYEKLLKVDEEEMLYLIQFRDPLIAVASGYTVMQKEMAADDIFEVVSTMQDEPDTLKRFPADLDWVEEDDLQKAHDRLTERVEACWQKYMGELDGLPLAELVQRFGEINAARQSHEMFMRIQMDSKTVQALLRFADPLAVLRDVWIDYKDPELTDDFVGLLSDVVFDSMEYEKEYTLAEDARL